MNKLVLVISVLVINFSFSQEEKVKTFRFNPKINFGFHSQNFIGDNYLSKGHKNPSVGIETGFQIFSLKKFNVGFGIKRTTIKISEFSIGGNINHSNMNSIHGFLSYDLLKIKKLNIVPEIQFGGLELKQKSSGRLYGTQNGNFYNFSLAFNYDTHKYLKPFVKVGYSNYLLKTQTSTEFQSYFNQSHSVNLTVGFLIL